MSAPNQLTGAITASPPCFASAPRSGGTLGAASYDTTSLYNTDYYAWTQKIKQMLESRAFEDLDVVNLIEEVEDMGKSVKRGLRSHLSNLLLHLLKWEYQPNIQTWSWSCSIDNARYEAKLELEENPSLNHQLNELFVVAYKLAVRNAVQQTGLRVKTFPDACPYTMEQALQDDWLPPLETTRSVY